jgi:HEAT repeat protein
MNKLLALGFLVCVSLTARGADVPALARQLKDGEVEDRRAAARALADLGAEAAPAVPALTTALKDRDLFVRRFSAQALGEIGPEARSALPALETALNDRRKEVQEAAAFAIGKMGSSGIQVLTGLVKDTNRDSMVRRKAMESLGAIGPDARSAIPALTSALGPMAKGKKGANPDDLRMDAVNALAAIATADDKGVIDSLTALTDKKQKDRALRQAANSALRKIKNRK